MTKENRFLLTRALTAYVLLFYFIRWAGHITPSGLQAPPLFNLSIDLTYWANWLLHIPDLVIYSRAGAVVFDVLVFSTGIAVLVYPQKRAWMIFFSLLIILYALNFNSLALIHTVTVNGLFLVFLPFWIARDESFQLAWEGIRYYTCLLYFLAFFWKTFYGDSFIYWPNGTGTFQSNLLKYLYYNPETTLSSVYRWFLRNNWMLNAGSMFVFMLEGIMIVGLFTKKYDRWLGWVPVGIVVINYFFADVFIFELLVLNFSFIPGRWWERLGNRWPVLSYSFRYGKKTN